MPNTLISTKKIIIVYLIFPVILKAQGGFYNKIRVDVTQICDFYRGNNFSSNFEAENALKKITNRVGIPKKFVIHPCSNINNCLAVNFNGINYILYDKDFMHEISVNTSYWSKLSILAHEIGHHVKGHCIDLIEIANGNIKIPSLEEKRQQELEADEFSGFVMQKLGASLSQAQSAMNKYSSNEDDSYSTHPARYKRLNAIEIGYNKAKKGISNYNFTLTFEDYFYQAVNSSNKKDQYKITNYTKSIDLNNGVRLNKKLKAAAFNNRGVSKKNLNNYRGAISDYNKAIELNPNDFSYYANRGLAKSLVEEYYSAISDFNKVNKLKPNYADAYIQKGLCLNNIKDYESAIKNYNKSLELMKKNNSLSNFQYHNDNSDYTIKDQFVSAFFGRGYAKLHFGMELLSKSPNFNGSVGEIDNPNIKLYIYEAIEDFSKSINIEDNIRSYMLRGTARSIIGDNYCYDFMKACELGESAACEMYYGNCK